ncbi:DEAD/DEAH box helicase [Myroides odoratimimus]|uniref:DEAD/DEAH box helicase n=1 Tax=Myroides odoratimimus TaxID=76832 RepID=UPI003100BD21
MNLKAGYIVDGISNIIKNQFPDESIFIDDTENENILKLKGLLETASNFNIKTKNNFEIDYNKIPKLLAVQNNILTRGLPTRAPLFLEQLFEEIGLSIREEKKIFEYRFNCSSFFKEKYSYQDVFKKLHLIFPGLNIAKQDYLGKLDSVLEQRFLDNSHPVFKQILQAQREFKTLVLKSNKENWVDFSHTLPYLFREDIKSAYKAIDRDNVYKTKVLEVDGPQHQIKESVYYDALRDTRVSEENGEVIRFPFYEIERNNLGANATINSEIEGIYIENYNSSIKEDLALYTYLLLPFNVARLQKFFIELFIRNTDLLLRDRIRICVIERDLPGAAIALKLFNESINNLNELVLSNDSLKLPSIELTLVQSKEWLYDSRLNLNNKSISLKEFKSIEYDIVVDNSLLVREEVYSFEHTINDDYYTLRSVHYVDVNSPSQIYCNESIEYKSLVVRNSDTSYTYIKELLPSIEYFLHDIFRKTGFREGQLPIISRALQKLPVIGLLPTGGGKSLTYQIPVFLQPTLSIIVDPIKSLMEDQVRVLRENWIDNVAYANSSQSQYIKNKSIVDFKLGTKQFLFVSPERFVIEEFRGLINSIDSTKKGQSIGYCIIDEVHCVSEWGHDFRYDYLLLGRNAQKYCKSKDGIVSLIGLTATASFDVLADIERELQIKNDDLAEAIIMIENTVRPELFFRVVDVSNSLNRSQVLLQEMIDFPSTFDFFNNRERLILSQKHHFENFDPKDFAQTNKDDTYALDINDQFIFKSKEGQLVETLPDPYASIVFCPVKGTKINESSGEFSNRQGVRYNHNLLCNSGIKAGYFYGADENDQQDNSKAYIKKSFNMFMNNNLSTMVCTKAFGMGIDKDNIRATFHINYASSLESLVQECGRAGRDKQVAVATILASLKMYYTFDYLKFTEFYKGLSDFDIRVIRQNLVNKYDSREHFIDELNKCNFPYKDKFENVNHYFTEFKIKSIKQIALENLDSLLINKSEDREIHDFFFENNFKGKRYENAQIKELFMAVQKTKEDFLIEQEDSEQEQLALYEVLEQEKENTSFDFIIPFTSKIDRPKFRIKDKFKTSELTPYEKQLILQTPFYSYIFKKFNLNKDKIFEAYKIYFVSKSTEEFWQKMEVEKIFSTEQLKELTLGERLEIEGPFTSQRDEVETGRIIYRLHAIGLLQGYTKDYQKEVYKCNLFKANSSRYYLDRIELFLKRYQSQRTAEESIKLLLNKLNDNSEFFFEDLLVMLEFLTDFTYSEISNKRRKATDEIKELIERILLDTGDEYQKNIIFKEEIYYYFNAKYARKGYNENGKDYSLLDDYYGHEFDFKEEILFKYIDEELLKNGTEQNNYKHLVGTCKKMLRNLTSSENNRDWLLHLLLAFSLYSTNNLSYRFDANRTLETGFNRLLNDQNIIDNDYEKIIEIFDFYFDKLKNNINENNDLLIDIDLIQNKVLQELQARMIKNYINQLENIGI